MHSREITFGIDFNWRRPKAHELLWNDREREKERKRERELSKTKNSRTLFLFSCWLLCSVIPMQKAPDKPTNRHRKHNFHMKGKQIICVCCVLFSIYSTRLIYETVSATSYDEKNKQIKQNMNRRCEHSSRIKKCLQANINWSCLRLSPLTTLLRFCSFGAKAYNFIRYISTNMMYFTLIWFVGERYNIVGLIVRNRLPKLKSHWLIGQIETHKEPKHLMLPK